VFLGEQPRPRPKGGPPAACPNFYGTHSTRNNDHILHGDQTRCEENFTRSLRMLTSDLFLVANLPVECR